MSRERQTLAAAVASVTLGAAIALWLLRYAQHVPLATSPSSGFPATGILLPLGILGGLCAVAVVWLCCLARGRRQRCPRCRRPLLLARTQPLPHLGSLTESVCPWGHGRRIVERGQYANRSRWVAYGPFWAELRRAEASARDEPLGVA